MKTKVIPMNYDWDKVVAGLTGFFGGMIMFIKVSWIDPTYWVSLLKAGVTAFVCGLLGVAGKYAFQWIRNKWFTKHKTK